MQIKEPRLVMEITDIICDVCEKSCEEYIAIEHTFGWQSAQDGTRIECDICEACFSKVKDFIVNTLKGKMRESSYN